MAEAPANELDLFRQEAGLSHGELWWRYFELGGMSDPFQLDALLQGALHPTAHDRDVIAHALNEHFVEQGGNHPVPYSADNPDVQVGAIWSDEDPGWAVMSWLVERLGQHLGRDHRRRVGALITVSRRPVARTARIDTHLLGAFGTHPRVHIDPVARWR